MARLLILAQWLVVLLYAKFGYFDTENADHWARFFSVSNQLILICWIVLLFFRRISKRVFFDAVFFNSCLVILWMQYYIPGLHQLVETYGILIPVLSFIIMTLCFDFILKSFQKNK